MIKINDLRHDAAVSILAFLSSIDIPFNKGYTVGMNFIS